MSGHMAILYTYFSKTYSLFILKYILHWYLVHEKRCVCVCVSLFIKTMDGHITYAVISSFISNLKK